MRNFLKTAVFILLLVLWIPATQAQEQRHVSIRLVPERGAVKPGDEIWIAIEQSIEPGWHTYWKNSGDSGTPPRIKWKIPYAFRIDDVTWPAPHKLRIGPLTSYGYEEGTTLLQKLKVPRDDMQHGPLTLTANIEILVCKEECIPEYGTYELILNGPESESEDNSAYIANARQWFPQDVAWPVTFTEKDSSLNVTIHKTSESADFVEYAVPGNIQLFPEDWGLVVNSAPPVVKRTNNGIEISQKRDQRSLSGLKETSFVLAVDEDGHRYAYALTAHPESAVKPMPKTALLNALMLALLGGLILNLMPCVFPVLSIKALSLVKISAKHPEIARLHGIAYTAGVVLCFMFIAALLIGFRSAGTEIGWGFHLQNSIVVTLLAYLLFLIGLNFFGWFEITAALGNFGHKLTQGHGIRNSFFTGVLATLVATPCTAPFMAAAIGAALTQPPAIALIIFAALGFGLALPYLILSFAPALQKLLPKPGKWMETFRQFLAFPMFASSAWLLWVLSQQAGPVGTFGALMGIVLIALGAWLLRYKKLFPALLAFAAAILLLPAGQMEPPDIKMDTGFGQAWTPEKLETALQGNDPVFVEMTAAWCITCKVNHAIAIDIQSTRKVFAANNVQYLVGDWTRQDARITEYLNSFNRNGVPIYVFYGKPVDGKRPEPVLLPQILTPGIVRNTVEEK